MQGLPKSELSELALVLHCSELLDKATCTACKCHTMLCLIPLDRQKKSPHIQVIHILWMLMQVQSHCKITEKYKTQDENASS